MPEDRPGKTDPTALTTDALRREIEGLKELLQAEIGALVRVTDERHGVVLEHIDRLERERREDGESANRRLDTALSNARELGDQQLDANREAIRKQDLSNQKVIESMKASFESDLRGVTREVGNLKERLDRDVTGKSLGLDAGKAWIVAAVGIVGGLVGIILALQ